MDPEAGEIVDANVIDDVTPEAEPSGIAAIMADIQAADRQLEERAPEEEASAPEPEPEPDVAPDDLEEPEPSEDASAVDQELAGAVDRWQGIMENVQIDGQPLNPAKAIDNYMSAIVSLQQDPVQTIAALARQYVKPQAAQTLLAALATQHNIDPFDVDVDQYQQQAPVMQSNAEVQQLKTQLLSMEINQMRLSGQYPVLDDVGGDMAALRQTMPGLSLADAYTLAVSRKPDLSAKHRQAVDGKGDTKKPSAAETEAARRQKVRRAKASDLPKGAAGPRHEQTAGGSIYDDVRAAAMEIGYLDGN